MNDGTEMDRLLQIDRMIDQVAAWRSGAGPQPVAATGLLAADQVLITELSRLGPADWPADEVGERITSTVAAAAARPQQTPEPAARAGAQETRDSSGHPRRRARAGSRHRWPRAAAPLAAAAAVIAVVGALVIVSSPHGRVTPPEDSASPARSAAPSHSPSPSMAPVPSSPFRSVGTGNLETNDFDCVTALVCYAWSTGNAGNGPDLRTSDGGSTWQQLAGLPDGLVVTNQTEPSCPTTQVCFAATGSLTLAVTTDGGSSWTLDQLSPPPGSSGDVVDAVSCATAQQCVAHLNNAGSGAFEYTTNGGQSWAAANDLPGDAPPTLYYLRCDTSGHCIGVEPGQAGLQVIRSADGGVTWTVSTVTNVPSATQLLMACGDGLHCVYVGDTGLASTTDGGVTWQPSTIPASWNGNISAVSCAGPDCFVAVNDQSVDGSTGPLIGTTTNLISWATQPAPYVDGSLIATIDSLSCPSPAGCVAVAQTQAEFDSGSNNSTGVATSQRAVISSLAGS
jgi:photosystem II stability/assembly factor-like uncharacterized protein